MFSSDGFVHGLGGARALTTHEPVVERFGVGTLVLRLRLEVSGDSRLGRWSGTGACSLGRLARHWAGVLDTPADARRQQDPDRQPG